MKTRSERSWARRKDIDVTLFQNPIFLTQLRLVHRAGPLGAMLITASIGLCLLAGLIYSLTGPGMSVFSSPEKAGKVFYGWLLVLESLVLIVGGCNRISRELVEERQAGLWDSNRLTPLRPSQLVVGYWLGPGLRNFYMSAVLAVLGLGLVTASGLPLTLWLGTQLLVFATALFFGLLAVAAALAFPRPQGGILLVLALILAQVLSLFQPGYLLPEFLLPTHATLRLFDPEGPWNRFPEFFGLRLHPIPYSLGLQGIVGFFVWRAAVQQAANSSPPLLRRAEGAALFAVLVAAQHGLIWGLGRGRLEGQAVAANLTLLVALVHGGTLLLGAAVLALGSPVPERVRGEAAGSAGVTSLRRLFRRSAVSSAGTLTVAAGALLLAQCVRSLAAAWPACLVAIGNLLSFYAVFSLLLEFCRLRFRRRALVIFSLGLFVLCVLPFLLAGVFSNRWLCRLSLLSPGVLALARPSGGELGSLLPVVGAHLAIAAAIFVAWRERWRHLLQWNPAGPGPRGCD